MSEADVSTLSVEEILHSLSTYDGTHPRQALEQAIARQDEITPHLLEALRQAKANVHDLPSDAMLHIWAMYLLAQFRETAAYPLIIDLLNIPSDRVDDVHGELVTERGASVLASVCGGDTGLIEKLAEDPNADQWVRGAALGAWVVLVNEGERTREEALAYFQRLIRTAQAPPDSQFWSVLAASSMDVYPDLIRDDLIELFNRDLVDPFFCSLDAVDGVLERGMDAALARLNETGHYSYIRDTIDETEWWASFQDPDSPLLLPTEMRNSAPPVHAAPAVAQPPFLPQRIILAGPPRQPGRNEPCPCGSGLKFKKCCLKAGKD